MLRKLLEAGLASVWATQVALPGTCTPFTQAGGVKAVGAPQCSHLLVPLDAVLADNTDWDILWRFSPFRHRPIGCILCGDNS